MIRYAWYLIFLSALSNVLIFVPEVLFDHAMDGTILSIVLTFAMSPVLVILFFKGMAKFPQQGLPEILSPFPLWVRNSILIFLGVSWFVAGMITISHFTDISVRFINPDMNEILFELLFWSFLILSAMLKSDKLLYLIEIVLLLNTPMIFLIMVKGVVSPYMNWHEVIDTATYVFESPSWLALSAATYVFTGYINLVVFNRVFPQPLHTKRMSFILGLTGFGLLTTFFIPIGFHGVTGIVDYAYPWVTTADSIRMEFGPVERVIYVFLLLYTSIALISATIHWHVGLHLLKSTIKLKQRKQWIAPMILVTFAFINYLVEVLGLNERTLSGFTEIWLQVRLVTEILVVLMIYILSRRVEDVQK